MNKQKHSIISATFHHLFIVVKLFVRLKASTIRYIPGLCIEVSGDFYRLIFVQIKNRQRKADGFLLWTRWGSNPQSLG